MDKGVIEILQKLVAEQGKEALLDSGKSRAYLADYAGTNYKKERRLILLALEAGVQKAIDAADNLAICRKQQVSFLCEEHFWRDEIATDVFDALALVLRGKEKEKNICATCGKEMQSDWKSCPYCTTSAKAASSLRTRSSPTRTTKQHPLPRKAAAPKPSKSNASAKVPPSEKSSWMWVVGIVIIVALGSFFVRVLVRL